MSARASVGRALGMSIKRLELRVRCDRFSVQENEELGRGKSAVDGWAASAAIRIIGNIEQEVLIALHLDSFRRITGYHEVGRGSMVQCPASPREVFRTAIVAGASSIVLAHNHPSGTLRPSLGDDAFTERVHSVGQQVGIELYDHVIVGLGTYNWYSYREAKRRPFAPPAPVVLPARRGRKPKQARAGS